MNVIRKLIHRHPPQEEHTDSQGIREPDNSPETTVEKLEEAEAWTARKQDEVDVIKREWLRYQFELEQETGRARRPRRS